MAAELREALTALGRTAGRAGALIEAMLALSRADVLSSAVPCDLAEAARRAVDGLEVECDLRPAPVTGDPVLLDRLTFNLVQNAVRYNRPGGAVRVETSLERGSAVLIVMDDGPVLDPAEVATLFERFRRRERTGDGFGLGLPIVATIVASHHGTITADARPSGGLEVTVRLQSGQRMATSAG